MCCPNSRVLQLIRIRPVTWAMKAYFKQHCMIKVRMLWTPFRPDQLAQRWNGCHKRGFANFKKEHLRSQTFIKLIRKKHFWGASVKSDVLFHLFVSYNVSDNISRTILTSGVVGLKFDVSMFVICVECLVLNIVFVKLQWKKKVMYKIQTFEQKNRKKSKE